MKKAFEIILVIVGIILGSMARIDTHMSATQISVITNQDTKVLIKSDGKLVSNVTIEGKEMLPIHNKDGALLYSPTLSLDNLTSYDNGDNYIFKQYDISIDKDIENAYLEIELEVSEDSLTPSVRALVRYDNETHELSAESPSYTFNKILSTKAKPLGVSLFYELADCTIEQINESKGVDVSIKLYANVKES